MSGLLKIAGELYNEYERLGSQLDDAYDRRLSRSKVYKLHDKRNTVASKIVARTNLPSEYDHDAANRGLNNAKAGLSRAHTDYSKGLREGAMMGGGAGVLASSLLKGPVGNKHVILMGGSALGGAILNKVYAKHRINKHTASIKNLEGQINTFKSA